MTSEPAATPSSGSSAGAGHSHGRVAAETGTVLVVQVTCTALRYVGAICLARALGVSLYGSFTLASTVVIVLGMVATLGTAPGALPLMAEARRAGDARLLAGTLRATWLVVAAVGLPITLLLLIAGGPLAERAFDDEALRTMLPWLSAFVVLSAASRATAGLVQGLRGAHRQALIEPLLVVAVTVAGIGCTWMFGCGVRGAAAATLAGPAAGLLAGLRSVVGCVPDALRLRERPAPLPLARLVRDSWPLMGVATFSFVLSWMDVLLMGVFRPAAEVGVYGACARLAFTVLLLHEASGPVFLARLSAHYVDGDWPIIRELYRATGRWSAWVGAIMAGALVAWRREFMGLFGPDFVDGAGLLVLLVAGRLVTSSVGLCGRMLAVTGKARLSMVNTVAMIVCNGLLDLLWIPAYGGTGAAAATCVSIVLVKAAQSAQVWMFFRTHPFSWRAALALPVVGLLAWLGEVLEPLHGVAWPVGLAAFLLACGAAWALLGTDGRDRELLRSLVSRNGG